MTSVHVLSGLIECCIEQGVFVPEAAIDPSVDLVESGLVDSMGLMMLASLIEETYDLVVPEALFVAELRTLTSIAAYLELELQAGHGRAARALAADEEDDHVAA
jgi:acyl carrier protein